MYFVEHSTFSMTSHRSRSIFLITASMALFFINSGCNSFDSLVSPVRKTQYENVNALMHANALLGEEKEKTYLKAHLKDGGVILFTTDWFIDSTRNVVLGEAQCYDINRRETYSGITETKAEDVILFETNSLNANRVASLKKNKVMFMVTAAALFVCIADPKICYGSCPTFYLEDQPENVFSSDAEGFSSAIHPSLEYTDCDGLGAQQVVDQSVSLTMKNEALETHCIDAISLVAIPIQEGERIYHNPENDFWRCRESQAPATAVSDNSEVSALLSSSDLNEYHRWTDKGNMLEKEDVYLTFPGIPNTDQYGLVLDFRQSLMSTYLFYGALSYVGPLSSDYYAQFGNKDIAKAGWKPSVFEEMGGIEVSVWSQSKKQWKKVGIFDETGPIAMNTQMLAIGQVDGEVKMRLRMTRGAGASMLPNLSKPSKKWTSRNGQTLPVRFKISKHPNKNFISTHCIFRQTMNTSCPCLASHTPWSLMFQERLNRTSCFYFPKAITLNGCAENGCNLRIAKNYVKCTFSRGNI